MTSAEPDVGLISPSDSLMAVLFPAPLGPSSPVMPSPTSKSTSSKARMDPYRLVKALASRRTVIVPLYGPGSISVTNLQSAELERATPSGAA